MRRSTRTRRNSANSESGSEIGLSDAEEQSCETPLALTRGRRQKKVDVIDLSADDEVTNDDDVIIEKVTPASGKRGRPRKSKAEEGTADEDILSSLKKKKTTPLRSSRKIAGSKLLPTLEEGQMLDTTEVDTAPKTPPPARASRRRLRSDSGDDSGAEEPEVLSLPSCKRPGRPKRKVEEQDLANKSADTASETVKKRCSLLFTNSENPEPELIEEKEEISEESSKSSTEQKRKGRRKAKASSQVVSPEAVRKEVSVSTDASHDGKKEGGTGAKDDNVGSVQSGKKPRGRPKRKKLECVSDNINEENKPEAVQIETPEEDASKDENETTADNEDSIDIDMRVKKMQGEGTDTLDDNREKEGKDNNRQNSEENKGVEPCEESAEPLQELDEKLNVSTEVKEKEEKRVSHEDKETEDVETDICTDTLKDGEVASTSSNEKVEEVERDEFAEGGGDGEACEDKLEEKKEVERKLNDSNLMEELSAKKENDEEVQEVAEIPESENVEEDKVAEVRNFKEKEEAEVKKLGEEEEVENEEENEEEEGEGAEVKNSVKEQENNEEVREDTNTCEVDVNETLAEESETAKEGVGDSTAVPVVMDDAKDSSEEDSDEEGSNDDDEEDDEDDEDEENSEDLVSETFQLKKSQELQPPQQQNEVASCTKSGKRKFSVDHSRYENSLLSNPMLKSVCQLKKNSLFQDFMKMKRNKTEENNTADVLSLDGVTMAGEIPPATSSKKFKLASSIQLSLNQDVFVDDKTGKSSIIDTNKNVEELMKKSVIQDGFEGKERAPKLFTSKHTAKLQAKKSADETAGKGWYNLPRTELTEKVKNDLQLIKMRDTLDLKHHYKRGDSKKLPKYFQMGTIVEGASEFYSSRLPKKSRKNTMVDELLADAEFRRKNKEKYVELRKKQMDGGKGHYKKKKNMGKKAWERT